MTTQSFLVRAAFVALVGCTGLASGACNEVTPAAAAPVNPSLVIDADPVALFPTGAVVLSNLDAHAFYASGSAGAQVAALAESMIPLGQEVGLQASRDIDRMVLAVYVGAGIEGVAMLQGRFDVARMQAAAAAHTPTRSGAPWVAVPYAGRTLFTAANVAFAPLSDHTMAAGSESAVRHVLDRLAFLGVRPQYPRELPDWMLQTVDTPGTSFALAADVAAIPPAALHGFPMPPGMNGLSRLAVVGDFHPPGFNVASTLTYADAAHASSGADALRQMAAFVSIASKVGAAPDLQNLSIQPEGPSVACRFVLDDEAMRRSLASVLKLFGAATAHPG